MKQHVLIIGLALIGFFFTAKAQQVNSISQLQPEQKAAAKSIVLTGTPTLSGNSDFRQLRDLCFRLNHLDLSRTNCPVIPKNALYSHHRLQTLLLPQGVEEIGSQAFFACDSLQTLRLPASLRTVGTAASSGCKRLSELRI
jgi:hexosaminidase